MTTGIKKQTMIKTASWVATAILLTGCNAGASGEGSAASYDVSSATSSPAAATQPPVTSYSSTSSVSTVSAKPSQNTSGTSTDGCESTGKTQGRWATCNTENQAPAISGSAPTTVKAGSTYSFKPTASDANNDKLRFAINNLPSWARFNANNGTLSGTPGIEHLGVYSNIQISVNDGLVTSYGPVFSIEVYTDVVVPPANTAPVISGTAPSSVVADSPYFFRPQASDANGDALSFAVQNLPAWAGFNAADGSLSGTPSNAHAGSYANVVISVTDGIDVAALAPFTITVTAANRAPVISGTPATSVTAGETYRFAPTASDVDGDALTFSVVYLPIWASFDSKTGTLSGTPTETHVGTYSNIRISVSDGTDTVAGSTFSIDVLSGNSAPQLSGTPATRVTAGEPYSFVPTASDVDGDTLSFSVLNLPAWARFDNATGAITGTPAVTDVGVYGNLRISVSDGSETTSGSVFSIEVQAGNSAPTVSGTPAGTVNAGAAYSFVPTASDADGDALSFSVQNLPAWASFDAGTGKLSGTPTDADVGLYSNIVISVSDGDLQTSGPAFSIDVTQISLGSATLSWTAPTQNMDGSTLTDLAGYKLYYGTTEGNYTEEITVDNPGISTFVVDNLAANTYYFVATAYNAAGVESPFSGVAVKVVN